MPMELLDVLDEGGDPSGLVRERSMVHERGDYHRTSHVWVVPEKPDGSHEVLLQKRSSRKDSFAGCYDISSAGHIPAGDGYLQSARRELKEELGITASEKNWNLPVFLRASMRGTFTESPLSTAKRLRSTFTEGRWRRNAWSSRPMRWNLSGGWIWRRPARQQKHRRTASVYRKESCCS